MPLKKLSYFLLQHPACNVNQADSGGWSALWYAVSDDNVKLVRALLSADADVTLTDADGRTVLEEAVDSEQDDMVALLKTANSS